MLARHFVKFPGSLNAADHAFHGVTLRGRCRKNARVNFHMPFRRECHESEIFACTRIGELGRDPDYCHNFPVGAQIRSELRNRITQLVRATKNSIEMLPPVIATLTSAGVSIAIPELITLTPELITLAATPTRILAVINYY